MGREQEQRTDQVWAGRLRRGRLAVMTLHAQCTPHNQATPRRPSLTSMARPRMDSSSSSRSSTCRQPKPST